MAEPYRDQVRLLLDILPLVMAEPAFALKGGTAINLFEWNLPRLSVDIDLTKAFVEARCVSHGELFGGKICAALDRSIPATCSTSSVCSIRKA